MNAALAFKLNTKMFNCSFQKYSKFILFGAVVSIVTLQQAGSRFDSWVRALLCEVCNSSLVSCEPSKPGPLNNVDVHGSICQACNELKTCLGCIRPSPNDAGIGIGLGQIHQPHYSYFHPDLSLW